MERRAFLRLIGMGALGMELDVDRLLWVPGAKTFFLPSPRSDALVTVNTLVTAEWIAREALRMFERNLALIKTVNRQYDAAWVGGRVDVRLPVRYRHG